MFGFRVFGNQMVTVPVFHNKFDDFDVFCLSEPMNSVETLLLRRRIPSRIQQVKTIGSRQVQANATCKQNKN